MSSLQQHRRLWEDWDIGDQRQPGDREHQTRVLWAAAGPGERRLWKGTSITQEADFTRNMHTLLQIHTVDCFTMWSTNFFFNSSHMFKHIHFSSCAGFSSPKSCWSCSGQNICHESFKKGTFLVFPHRCHNTALFKSLQLEWCTAVLSLYPLNIIACLLLQINIMVLLSANIGRPWSRWWGKISLLVGRLPPALCCAAAALALKSLCLRFRCPLDSAWYSHCFCLIG